MKLVLLVCASILAFVGCELLVRGVTGTMLLWEDPDVVEPTIGQMMRPGMALRIPFTGFRVTIGEHSTRANGDQTPPRERPLTLAVGDSFTFGEDVSDSETWPAILERTRGSRVVNGGAPGFGFDQIVLRAEQLAAIYAPDVLVASFIPDDVARCESSNFSGHAKPYFEIEGTELRMHPISTPPQSFIQRLMGRSMLLHILFYNVIHSDPEAPQPRSKGKDVSCLLMNRLAAIGASRGTPVIVLAQPQSPDSSADDLAVKDHLLACARRAGLATVDVFPVIERLAPSERAPLFDGHMTPAGNAFVAQQVLEALHAHAR